MVLDELEKLIRDCTDVSKIEKTEFLVAVSTLDMSYQKELYGVCKDNTELVKILYKNYLRKKIALVNPLRWPRIEREELSFLNSLTKTPHRTSSDIIR